MRPLSGKAALWVMWPPGFQKGRQMKNIWFCCIDFNHLFFGNAILDQRSAFQNLAPTLSTVQLSHWMTSLEAIHQMTCIFLIYSSCICSSAPWDLWTHSFVKLVELPFKFTLLISKRSKCFLYWQFFFFFFFTADIRCCVRTLSIWPKRGQFAENSGASFPAVPGSGAGAKGEVLAGAPSRPGGMVQACNWKLTAAQQVRLNTLPHVLRLTQGYNKLVRK